MQLSDSIEYGVPKKLIEKLRARGIDQLTSAQALALEEGVCRDQGILVAAPTSSGKTLIAELVAVQAALEGQRTVYLVSHRALAEEKFRLFKKEYAQPGSKWFNVSIATGDRAEGEWDDGILVATYEKYLALLCSGGNWNLSGIVIVADEIQLLGDPRRGPEVELLCALIKKGKPKKVVGLSATISNSQEISAWLGGTIVQTNARDVPLHQEVWFQGNSIQSLAGTTQLFEGRRKSTLPSDTLTAIETLLKARQGPVLVFAMTKRRALELAEAFAERRQNTADGISYVDQFDLFSEPSTLVRSLMQTAQKKVAFHTADLSYAERELVEQGLINRQFDVVFATPTLAAGVNFPFQSVLFDSFHRGWVQPDPWLSLAEYQNMAGRAGRLGLHEKGHAVLLPQTEVDFERARSLIGSHVEPLNSNFFSCSLRKVVLTLIASRVIRREDDLLEFVRGTLWWYQTEDKNPKKLQEIPALLQRALEYLEKSKLIASKSGSVFATPLGAAAAATSLLPTTVVELLHLFKGNQHLFAVNNDAWIPGTLYAACSSPEFAEGGQRTLPYSRRNQPEHNALLWVRAQQLFQDPDTTDQIDKVANASYALAEWINGQPERSLRNMIPAITYGQLHQLSTDVSLILEGLSKVTRVPDADCPITIANNLSSLAERLRYGAPADVLDLLRAAKRYDVPGFGRQRAMALHMAGLSLPNDVLKADRNLVAKIVENKHRADALIDALLKYFDAPLDTLKVRHVERARGLDIDPTLIQQSYDAVGNAYEEAVELLLTSVKGWNLTKSDTGKRQAFPDFILQFLGKIVLVECKTKQKDTATLSKDEAFAVLTKGADFRKDHCVTIGKPDFDETSKVKANGSDNVTLLRHHDLVEAILRYSAQKITADQLFSWITTPGYARLDQLDALTVLPAIEPYL